MTTFLAIYYRDDYMADVKWLDASSSRAAADGLFKKQGEQVDDRDRIFVVEKRHVHKFTVVAPREDPQLRDDDQ